MDARKNTRVLARWAFWPAIVILALNIEKLAAAVGADSLLIWLVQQGGPISNSVAKTLFSDATLHVALVLTGAGLLAWWEKIPSLMRRERVMPIDPRYPAVVADNCEALAFNIRNWGDEPKLLQSFFASRFKNLAAYSRAMKRFGLPPPHSIWKMSALEPDLSDISGQ